MRMRAVVVPTVVAVVTSALTTALWLSIAPASAGVGKVSVISSLSFTTRASQPQHVERGDVAASVAKCPSDDWREVSGGYVIDGDNGLTVPTATEDYPGTGFDDWHVAIANPKISSGTIGFDAEILCMKENFTTVPG